MADSEEPTAIWPGSPYDLTDTHRCPACFATLTQTTCGRCGIVLADPRAVRLLELGRSIVAIEDERQQLIDEIRLAHRVRPPAAAPVAAPVWWQEPGMPVPAGVQPVDVAASEPGPAPLVLETPKHDSAPPAEASAPPAAAAAPPAAASFPPPRPVRRLSVPVLLLIVGVSLVGVAAVFFLGLAWFVAGILVRALIIGGVTVATMVGASLLRRGSLRATAEAIGALGVILLALDAYAVRANDFFGTGDADPFAYAGASALVVAAVCRAWSFFSRLRGPDLAATLAAPAGLGLLVGGLLPLETTAAFTAGLLGAAAGGLLHALPAPWSAARPASQSFVERTALAVIGIAALAIATGTSLMIGLGSLAAQCSATGAIVVLGIAHALLLRRRPDDEIVPAAGGLAATAASLAALAAGTLGWQLARLSDQPAYPHLVAPVVAVAVAVGLDRWAHPGVRTRAPRIVGAAVGVASIAALMIGGLLRGESAISASWIAWQTDVFATSLGSALTDAVLAAVAAAVVAALLFRAPTLDRAPLRDSRAAVAALLVIAGAVGTGIAALIVGVGVAVAAIALIALGRGASRVGWGVAAGLGATTAFVAGLASPWLWAIGVVVAIAVPVVARIVVHPAPAGAVGLALAPVIVAAVAASIAPGAIAAAAGVTADPRAAAVLVQWVAVAVLACAVLLRLEAASRTALAIAAYALTVFSLLGAIAEASAGDTVSGVIGEPPLAIVRSALLVILLGAVALRRTPVAEAPALAAAALLAPVAACLAVGIAGAFDAASDPALIGVVVAAAAVVWLGALLPARLYGSRGPIVTPASGTDATTATGAAYPVLVRRIADLGALATVVVVAWAVSADLRWVALIVVAAGFAGASVTRGWAGVRTDEPAPVPETRATGAAFAQAPRRVLAWPAFATATFALWSWLGQEGGNEIEAYALPPAVGLLLFTVLLVWLRRRAEATVAIVLSFALGLIVPAIDSLTDDSLRGPAVAIVASVLAVVLAWTPLRRVRPAAVAGAATAMAALAIVVLDRGVFDPIQPEWSLLLIGAAFAAASGFPRVLRERGGPASGPEAWFAILVPVVSLVVGIFAVAPSLADPLVAAVALTILCLLHLAAAAVHRLPLAAATRWTAFAGAVVIAGIAYAGADVDAVEILSIPLALALLGGAAMAMWRRAREGAPWPGGERIAWLSGLALAVVPSIFAEPDDPRTWLVIAGALLAAIGCVVAPLPGSVRLKTPSAVLLAAGAIVMAVRALFDPAVESGEFAAVAAGVGALLVAAAIVWIDDADARPVLVVGLGVAGAALLLLTVGLEADGALVRTTITAALAGAIGVGGAALLGLKRWAGLGAVLALGGLAGAAIAVAARYVAVLGVAEAGIELDLWALVGLGITAAIGVMALRSSRSAAVARAVGIMFALSILLFAAAEVLLLGDGDRDSDAWRTVLTVTAVTVVRIVGVVFRARLGAALAVASAVAAVVFGLVAVTVYGVRPIELVTVPVALGMVLLGARRLRRDASARTWPALGPGLALLTVPSLAFDFGESELWRVVALGVVAVVLVVAGAVWKLQAPLVLGSAVLLVHAFAQLWPWISDVYVAVPWWLWLGLGGALLIFIAARYEKRMRALRAAFTAVTSLR